MAKEAVLKTETRTLSGTASSRRMRRDGWLPGVINLEKGGTRMIRLNQHDFEQMLHRHRSESLILDVVVDTESPRKMLLKDVQHHPLTGHAIHIDLIEISMTKKMRFHIPVRLRGDPVGVTQEGGILEQPLRSVEVECLPTDLVEEIDLDVSGLKLGHSILVRDLKLDAKLIIVSAGDNALAAVSAPRAEEEVKPEEAAAVATTEPELIGAKEKEEKAAAAAAEVAAAGKEKKEEKKEKKEKK
jgi:large subunit ribosomal protein L25